MEKNLPAKSCIVVLGNFKDRLYHKSQLYAPVLKYGSLCLLIEISVSEKLTLQQGDYKNTFCNAQLPEGEVIVIHTPIGDPSFQEDEY